MSAAVNGAAWIYTSFGGVSVGWHLVGGTSEASPIFSGIVALADQVAHHRLGLLNPGLYLLGALSQHGSKSTGIMTCFRPATTSASRCPTGPASPRARPTSGTAGAAAASDPRCRTSISARTRPWPVTSCSPGTRAGTGIASRS
jgi:hypothetical protein